jgi:hypothetical protein
MSHLAPPKQFALALPFRDDGSTASLALWPVFG